MTATDHPPQDDSGYEAYARFCLDLAAKQPDRRHRMQLREMAAAWLNVADGAAPSFSDNAAHGRPAPDGHAPR